MDIPHWNYATPRTKHVKRSYLNARKFYKSRFNSNNNPNKHHNNNNNIRKQRNLIRNRNKKNILESPKIKQLRYSFENGFMFLVNSSQNNNINHANRNRNYSSFKGKKMIQNAVILAEFPELQKNINQFMTSAMSARNAQTHSDMKAIQNQLLEYKKQRENGQMSQEKYRKLQSLFNDDTDMDNNDLLKYYRALGIQQNHNNHHHNNNNNNFNDNISLLQPNNTTLEQTENNYVKFVSPKLMNTWNPTTDKETGKNLSIHHGRRYVNKNRQQSQQQKQSINFEPRPPSAVHGIQTSKLKNRNQNKQYNSNHNNHNNNHNHNHNINILHINNEQSLQLYDNQTGLKDVPQFEMPSLGTSRFLNQIQTIAETANLSTNRTSLLSYHSPKTHRNILDSKHIPDITNTTSSTLNTNRNNYNDINHNQNINIKTRDSNTEYSNTKMTNQALLLPNMDNTLITNVNINNNNISKSSNTTYPSSNHHPTNQLKSQITTMDRNDTEIRHRMKNDSYNSISRSKHSMLPSLPSNLIHDNNGNRFHSTKINKKNGGKVVLHATQRNNTIMDNFELPNMNNMHRLSTQKNMRKTNIENKENSVNDSNTSAILSSSESPTFPTLLHSTNSSNIHNTSTTLSNAQSSIHAIHENRFNPNSDYNHQNDSNSSEINTPKQQSNGIAGPKNNRKRKSVHKSENHNSSSKKNKNKKQQIHTENTPRNMMKSKQYTKIKKKKVRKVDTDNRMYEAFKALGNDRFKKLREIYSLMDVSGTSKVSISDAMTFNGLLNPSERIQFLKQDAQLFFAVADTNNDGFINEGEWMKVWSNVAKTRSLNAIDKFLTTYDRIDQNQYGIDDSSTLSLNILHKVMEWLHHARTSLRKKKKKRSSVPFKARKSTKSEKSEHRSSTTMIRFSLQYSN